MKTIKEFLAGSKRFFNNLPDFKSHDTDLIRIVDLEVKNINTKSFHWKVDDGDIFFFKEMTKDEYVKEIIRKGSLSLSSFIVPEFCEYIGFNIEDLRKISKLFNKIDPRHRYVIMIKDFYLENNKMELTSEQLNAVYEEYKKERQKDGKDSN